MHELTAPELNAAIGGALLADLAQAVHCDVDRLAIRRLGPGEGAPRLGDEMGIELLVASGACDVLLDIAHAEDETQHDTPEALLAWVLKAPAAHPDAALIPSQHEARPRPRVYRTLDDA